MKPSLLDSLDWHAMLLHVAARERRKTHCHRGHLLAPPNVYLAANGHRSCKRCRNRRVIEGKG